MRKFDQGDKVGVYGALTLFLTKLPFDKAGTGLFAKAQGEVLKVFETRKPVLSSPHKSPISNKIIASLSVPIIQNGKVAYCLRMVLNLDTFGLLLKDQKLPPSWISAILDGNGLIVARSIFQDQYVGKEASANLKTGLLNHTQGIFEAVTLEGVPVYSTIVEVPTWNWSVAIGVPKKIIDAPFKRAMTILILVALVVSLMSIVSAILLSKFITSHVADLLSISSALHRGDQVNITKNSIHEFEEMCQHINKIHQLERDTKLALLNVTADHDRIENELQSARCDTLTGLPARALFLELVEGMRKTVNTHRGNILAILFIDLDGFKNINDTFGPDQGDKILVQVGEILRNSTRISDVIARLGGDEFVVCLTASMGEIEEIAREVASRIVTQVSEIGLGISCSIGISLWSDSCPDLSCALKSADDAMYEAKRNGKNRYVIFGVGKKNDGSSWTNHSTECQEDCALVK